MIRRSRGISEILPMCNPIQSNPIQSLPFPLNSFQPSNFHSRYLLPQRQSTISTSVLPSASFPHSEPQPTGAEKGLPKRYKKPKFATPCMLTYLGRYSRWCSFQLGYPKKEKRETNRVWHLPSIRHPIHPELAVKIGHPSFWEIEFCLS